MNPYAIIGAIAAFGWWSWWIYGQGAASCEAKVEKTTTTETVRQSDDVGTLKAAEASHAPKVNAKIETVRTAPDPSGCRDMPMPPDILNALGVHDDKVRHSADQP
jgi:hypothetical protein